MPRNLTNNMYIFKGLRGAIERPDWFHYRGVISNINFFDRIVPLTEMQRLTTTDNCNLRGDYLAWGDTKWAVSGVVEMERVKKRAVCKAEPNFWLFTDWVFDFAHCEHLCQAIQQSKAVDVTTRESFEDVWADLSDIVYDINGEGHPAIKGKTSFHR